MVLLMLLDLLPGSNECWRERQKKTWKQRLTNRRQRSALRRSARCCPSSARLINRRKRSRTDVGDAGARSLTLVLKLANGGFCLCARPIVAGVTDCEGELVPSEVVDSRNLCALTHRN